MASRRQISERFFLLAFLIAVPLEAVTVPICPTNKIAPHRRHIQNWDYKARTLGAFYDLLAPNNQYQNGANDEPSDLTETPDDDPDDCGEIEDYDENDLSSIIPQVQRRQGINKFFGSFRPPYNYPVRPPSVNLPQRPERPPQRPERPPQRPERPPLRPERPPQTPGRPPFPNYPVTRPPYWSGGFFGANGYRPPFYENPSDNIKPIYENAGHIEQPYQPSVVGGPSGHIIGASPARPSINNYETTTRIPYFPTRNPQSEPERTPRPYPTRTPFTPSTPSNTYPIRGQRPRNMNSNGILGSFVDLLFK